MFAVPRRRRNAAARAPPDGRERRRQGREILQRDQDDVDRPAETLEGVVDRVRKAQAPDPRILLFDVRVDGERGVPVLDGVVSSASAVDALELALAEAGLEARLRIRVLHAADRALVTSAVAPVHASASVRSTQVSQVILGSTVRVLRREGSWMHCRFEDGYLGWVHAGYVTRVSAGEADRWARDLSIISLGAEATEGGRTILPLPWGARVQETAPHRALLPDGREVEVSGELIPLAEVPERFPHRSEAVLRTADRWLGSPYLWGGRTRAGVDCSGFVQNLFGLHGVALPRDSDQQARVGEKVRAGERFENLLPGDLLFFGKPRARITHVALSEGGGRIIHAFLGNGSVCRSDLNAPTEREDHLPRWFRGARRILL